MVNVFKMYMFDCLYIKFRINEHMTYARFLNTFNLLSGLSMCCCVCIINSYNNLLNWPNVSLLFLFICFSMFFVLIHDYTQCFTGSPCCKFSYYNYISIWPYYIVIHFISYGSRSNMCRYFVIVLVSKLGLKLCHP